YYFAVFRGRRLIGRRTPLKGERRVLKRIESILYLTILGISGDDSGAQARSRILYFLAIQRDCVGFTSENHKLNFVFKLWNGNPASRRWTKMVSLIANKKHQGRFGDICAETTAKEETVTVDHSRANTSYQHVRMESLDNHTYMDLPRFEALVAFVSSFNF
ncbi:hypothetical protein M8C21_018120, partial [Ambrosia artemisiifolia]